MGIFNNHELSTTLCKKVEEGLIDEAINLLVSENGQLSKKADSYLCDIYLQSNNPKNWEIFWEILLQKSDKLPEKFIKDIILVSQQKHLPNFLVPVLNFSKYNRLIEMQVLGPLLRENNIDYLSILLQNLENQSNYIKFNFYSSLIQISFLSGNFTVLQFLSALKEPFNFSGCIEQFNLEQLIRIANPIVLKKFNPDFVINLIKNINFNENKLTFCKEIIMLSFKENNVNLLEELLNSDSDNFIEIITTLTRNDRKLLMHALAFNQPTDIRFIKKILEQLSPEDKVQFYNELIVESFNVYSIRLLQELSSLTTPYDFHTATKDLDQTKLNKFLTLDERQSIYIQQKMNVFSKGYGYIKYNDALLSLAQRRNRKKYNFDPVLVEENELNIFVEILSSADKPITQSFICSGDHFISGKILIEPDGNAKIFLIDSLGTSSGVYYDEFLINFALKFPQHEIFVSKETRQNASKGCSVFALDDIAHLENLRIENHQNIWDYLTSEKKPENNVVIKKDDHVVNIYAAPLPISLTRTMQSNALLTEVIPQKPERVKNFPINKKNQTIEDSVKPFFKEVSSENNKRRNTRLDYKLSQMTEQNWGFLANHSENEVEEAMKYFTLDSFKERISQKKEQASYNIENTKQCRSIISSMKQEASQPTNLTHLKPPIT